MTWVLFQGRRALELVREKNAFHDNSSVMPPKQQQQNKGGKEMMFLSFFLSLAEAKAFVMRSHMHLHWGKNNAKESRQLSSDVVWLLKARNRQPTNDDNDRESE